MTHFSTRRTLLALAWGVFCLFIAGCSSMNQPLGGPQPAPAVVAAGQVSPADRAFLSQAASRAMYEAEVSRLAASRATSPNVRSYAQAVASHRAVAGSELAALMRAKGATAPAALPADKATKLRRLAALRPSPDFDIAYVRVVGIEDQMMAISVFERAGRNTADPDVKAWIDKTLPVLRGELAAARALANASAG